MKKETKSKTTQDQLFETTPVSESAERLGQTFAQEWARIENGHRYWRNAVCMLVFGLLVTGVLFGSIFSDKMDDTVQVFASIAKNEQNATATWKQTCEQLMADNLQVRRELNETQHRLKMNYRVHSELRSAARSYLQAAKQPNKDGKEELERLRIKLNRTMFLIDTARPEEEGGATSTD